MTDNLRIMMAQLNPTLGDMVGNLDKARKALAAAQEAGADMLVLPEMFLVGYQAQDMVQKKAFTDDAWAKLNEFAAEVKDVTVGIGFPVREGDAVFNVYAILSDGKIQSLIHKHHLPNYKVFDEKRLFQSGEIHGPYSVNGVRIGSPICEDAWFEDVCEALEETGAEILVVPNGSPYYRGKFERRMSHMVSRVVETGLPMVYLNLVG